MTAERRLAAIETSLSPTQLVLRWLAEAHAFGDIEPYVASLLAEPSPPAPLDRLAREAVRGAKAAIRGKRSELVDAAVRSALRETVFRFELVMRINVTAHDLLDRETLMEAVFASQLALLACDERKERLRDESHLRRLGQCRDLTALRVRELLAAQDARAIVEARYLDGHGALFLDVVAAFEEQLHASQQLAVMAMDLAELDGVEPAEPGDPNAVKLRAGELVADLVEPAKSTALEKLGEGEPALDIANRWLRAKLASRAVLEDEPVAPNGLWQDVTKDVPAGSWSEERPRG
jgi:hypothetical protein